MHKEGGSLTFEVSASVDGAPLGSQDLNLKDLGGTGCASFRRLWRAMALGGNPWVVTWTEDPGVVSDTTGNEMMELPRSLGHGRGCCILCDRPVCPLQHPSGNLRRHFSLRRQSFRKPCFLGMPSVHVGAILLKLSTFSPPL